MQEGIVGDTTNAWKRPNIAAERSINFLTYDFLNNKVYSTDTKNIVTFITVVEYNGSDPSAYSHILMR
jgi:hypothetical protein